MIPSPLRQRRRILGLVLGAAGVLGCSDKTVVADVGQTQVHQADLAAFVERRSHAGVDSASLDSLVDRELLAEGGRREALEKDPAVAARLAAADREILAEAYLEEQIKPLTTEEALRARFTAEQGRLKRHRVHVQQIAFLFGPDAGPQRMAVVHAKASQIYARALHGEDFAALAREASDDAVGKEKGGDVGWLEEGQVAQPFFDAALPLHRGELAPPVETPFGVHLIRALEDSQDTSPKFAEVRAKLAAEARSEGEVQILADLRRKMEVKLHPENMVAARPGVSKL